MKKEQYALITYLLFFVVTATVVSVLYKRNQQLEEYDLIQHKLEQLFRLRNTKSLLAAVSVLRFILMMLEIQPRC